VFPEMLIGDLRVFSWYVNNDGGHIQRTGDGRLPGGGLSVLLVVVLGKVLRQGVNRLGGDWLSISCFVENKGSNWVRFVIWFWVRPGVALQSRVAMALATGSGFPGFV